MSLRHYHEQDEAECNRLWREELSEQERLRIVDWSNGLDVELTADEQLAAKWFVRTMILGLES